jgi:hypothetical protein
MHDCINCGCACYCHGDIDDCAVETVEYAYDHCEGCGCAQEPDGGWPDDEPESSAATSGVLGTPETKESGNG